jgi:hypothetical protein
MSADGYELVPALIDRPGKWVDEDPKLTPGDHVKLGFRIPGRDEHEWMWVEVTSVEGNWPNAVYRGELRNRPVMIDPKILRAGKPIEFRAGHIYGFPDRGGNELSDPTSSSAAVRLQGIERRLRILGMSLNPGNEPAPCRHLAQDELFDLAVEVRFAWSDVTGLPAYPEDDDDDSEED